MTSEEQDQVDYLKSWRGEYEAARESRNAAVMLWVGVAGALAAYYGNGAREIAWTWLLFAFGGFALALLGHYQSVIHTYYQALKGTRDEPPRDELAARRRR